MGEETDNGNQRGTVFFKQSTAICWFNVRCTVKRLVHDEPNASNLQTFRCGLEEACYFTC